jgi:glycosyltransferase involved in cell wall biosynthesis
MEPVIFIYMNKDITIVIPCKNEGQGIIQVLKLIVRQGLDCQIIIADSSKDNTFILMHNYRSRSPQVIRIIEGGLPSVARNKGAKLVTTPYVLFLDADMYLKDKNLVKKCLEVAKKGDYDLVTCKFKTLGGKFNWVYRVFDVIQLVSSKTRPFAIGGFMIFKTDTFNKLGGFNEEDKVAEDYHLSSKVSPKKFRIVNCYAHTTSRRFDKKGVWYMIKLAWQSWLNRNNDEWFKKDHNYWT